MQEERQGEQGEDDQARLEAVQDRGLQRRQQRQREQQDRDCEIEGGQDERPGDQPAGQAAGREERERLRQAELAQDHQGQGQERQQVVVALAARTDQAGKEEAIEQDESGRDDLREEEDQHSIGEALALAGCWRRAGRHPAHRSRYGSVRAAPRHVMSVAGVLLPGTHDRRGVCGSCPCRPL